MPIKVQNAGAGCVRVKVELAVVYWAIPFSSPQVNDFQAYLWGTISRLLYELKRAYLLLYLCCSCGVRRSVKA